MAQHEKLYTIAKALMAPDKGVLAADESTGTMNKRLAAVGVPEEAEMRRKYRQLLFTCPDAEQYMSGVILYDASIRNHTDDQTPFVDVLTAKGIIPIIKVDKGTRTHNNFPNEVVTQGLDDLQERLEEYYDMGARAAKWRAVVTIGEGTPTDENLRADSFSLARYAAMCQEVGIVPMVEPEVLHAGSHSIERAEEVTTRALVLLFEALAEQKVDLKGLILKSSMVLAGSEFAEQSTAQAVAEATLRTFNASVPHDVAGIVFLSGGQTPTRATENLDIIAEQGKQPWPISFSYSRAIEEPILDAWRGDDANIEKAQAVMLERLKLNSMARTGAYETSMDA